MFYQLLSQPSIISFDMLRLWWIVSTLQYILKMTPGILPTTIVIWAHMILTGFEALLSFPKAGVKPYSLGPRFISLITKTWCHPWPLSK
jgi:hypothetical protein